MTRSGEEALVGGYSGRLLGVLSVATMATVSGRLLLAPLLPTIIRDLSISPSKAGIALSATAAFAGLLQYPGGRFADHLSRKTVLVVAFALLMTGFAILAAATSYPLLLLGVTTVGIGGGLFSPAGTALLSDLFVDRRGQAFGVTTAASNVGGAVAAVLAVVALTLATWQAAYVPVVVLLAGVLVFMHTWNAEPYIVARPPLNVLVTARRLTASAQTRRVFLAGALYMIAYQGTVNFLPTLLELEKGFDGTIASGAFAVLFIVGTVVNPIAGKIGDRVGYAVVASGGAVLAATGVGSLLLADSLPGVVAAVVVFALGGTVVWSILSAHAMSLFPADTRGGDYGALGSLCIGLGSLGPTYVGVVSEFAGYENAFGGLVVCFLASAVVACWLALSDRE